MVEPCEMTLHGITLSNVNLTATDNLQVQLVMILEILTDHTRKFDEVNTKVQRQAETFNKRMQEQENTVRTIQQAMSLVTQQMKSVADDIENLDKSSKRIEKKVDDIVEQVDQGLSELRAAEAQLRFRLDNHEPRISKNEVEIGAHIKTTAEEFTAINEKVEENIAQTTEKIEDLLVKQKASRVKLDHLEKAFQAADIEGLTQRVDEQAVQLSRIVEDHEKKEKEVDERIASLETGTVHLRKEVSEIKPYCDDKFSTKVDVKVLSDKLELFQQEFITRKEFLEVQDDFHSQMTNFIMTELNTQRMDIYQKMTTVQERLTAEIEEASKGEEVQMCVQRLQDFTRDIEDLGQSVAQHNDALEQSAFQIQSMGREMFGEIDTLKDTHGELNTRVEGVMAGMHATVKAAIEEISMTSGFGGLLQRGASGSSQMRRGSNTFAIDAPMGEDEELDEDDEDEDDEDNDGDVGDGGRSPSARSAGSRPQSAAWLQPPEQAEDGASRPGSSRSIRDAGAEVQDDAGHDDRDVVTLDLVPSRPSTGTGSRRESRRPSAVEALPPPAAGAADAGRPASSHGSVGAARTASAGSQSTQAGGRLSRGASRGTQAESEAPQRFASAASAASQTGRGARRASLADTSIEEGVAPPREKRERRAKRRSSTTGEPTGLPGDMEGVLMNALANLQKVLEDQMTAMRSRMLKEFVPKEHLDNTVKGFSRKFADLDWKLVRARPETGENEYRNRMYNQRLFGMTSPFLLAETHPAEKKKRENDPAGIQPPANPYQIPRAITPNNSTVATSFFESPEMRAAMHAGSQLRTRGSSAAQRLYKRDQPSFAVDIPPSLENVLSQSASLEDLSSVSLPRPRSSTPTRVTMLPRIEHIYPSDATHPWQIGPPRAVSPPFGQPLPPPPD